MPHYFFNLRTSDTSPSKLARSGDFPDLGSALAEANSAARGVIRKRERSAPLDLHGSLDIEDERHQPLARILLAELARQIS